mmetsp:Transcript_3544/g.7368  ORF Transcript_3544/g.7368 Transcript_3544/m.7368 type:complete len:246 (-) Transcript_3544:182-919(-)
MSQTNVSPAPRAHREVRDFSDAFALPSSGPDDSSKSQTAKETDPHRICQRLKQIEYGRHTLGYERYLAAVPKHKRKYKHPKHPVTPDVRQICSKRSWDGQVKKWRRGLHEWDPEAGAEDVRVDIEAVREKILGPREPSAGAQCRDRSSRKPHAPGGIYTEASSVTPDQTETGQKRKERDSHGRDHNGGHASSAAPPAESEGGGDSSKKPKRGGANMADNAEKEPRAVAASATDIYNDFDNIWNLD